MMRISHLKCLATCLALFSNHFLLAQSLPIALDGQFGDWTSAAVTLNDGVGGGVGLDLLKISVANDEENLYIRLEMGDDVVLTDNNDLTLFIDGDHNSLTGKSINGIGAELELRLGDRNGIFYKGNSTWYLDLPDVDFVNLPNFSSKVFEIAIGRNVLPDNQNPLFTGTQIRLFIQNGVTGDRMPNTGEVFSFTFGNSATSPFQPIDLQKLSPDHLRLMTWNTLSDGLLDIVRKPHFQRVTAAISPDIVTFNECWDMTAIQAIAFMNTAVPLGSGQSWYAVKLEDGNITLSRFPILQSWNIYPGHRLMASLIDLPDDDFEKDILVINGHLRCCSANSDRQLEADAFAKFILDAKSPGGLITLPENTPFVLSGDMNLVGDGQQYTTLVSGDIVNTNIYGQGAPLDWDGTDLLDVVALQADQRMAYTWRNQTSQYPPSRLDFHFCSNSVLSILKTFSLQTEIMSLARLSANGLFQNDTGGASDHLPKVTDFTIKPLTEVVNSADLKSQIYLSPNPAMDVLKVDFDTYSESGEIQIRILNGLGQLAKSAQFSNWNGSHILPVEALPNGIYWVQLEVAGELVAIEKFIISR